MIPLAHTHGLHLPEPDLWLDAKNPKPFSFVSHAHADHFARHGRILCSEATAVLLRARYGIAETRLLALAYHASTEHSGHLLKILPAGHICGSAMLHVTRLADGATLLYTGDFKTRASRTADAATLQQADTLIMETTFGLPRYTFPPTREIDAAILRFIHNSFEDGDVPILLGYSLGKAQEVAALLHENGIPMRMQKSVAEMTIACRETGLRNLPEPVLLESEIPSATAVIAAPNTIRMPALRSIKNRRVAMLSGWAMDPAATYRYRVDEAIPLSDHADYPSLLETVQRVRPKLVLTVHGSTREFAAELRQRGLEAWSVHGDDQLEIPLSSRPGPSARGSGSASRHKRPICPFADFSDFCRLAHETHSRLEKARLLVEHLKRVAASPDGSTDSHTSTLGLTIQWLNRAAPLAQIPGTIIHRAILDLPGAREDRIREISLAHKDLHRAVRLTLQELSLNPLPASLAEIQQFLTEITTDPGTLAAIRLLATRLQTLHPAESETLVRLLSGQLETGLTRNLVREAVTTAIGRNLSGIVSDVRIAPAPRSRTSKQPDQPELFPLAAPPPERDA